MRQVPLRIVGIGDQACLMACDSQGTMFELHPDGNRHASAAANCAVQRCACVAWGRTVMLRG